jgi:hypothetical protein
LAQLSKLSYERQDGSGEQHINLIREKPLMNLQLSDVLQTYFDIGNGSLGITP